MPRAPPPPRGERLQLQAVPQLPVLRRGNKRTPPQPGRLFLVAHLPGLAPLNKTLRIAHGYRRAKLRTLHVLRGYLKGRQAPFLQMPSLCFYKDRRRAHTLSSTVFCYPGENGHETPGTTVCLLHAGRGTPAPPCFASGHLRVAWNTEDPTIQDTGQSRHGMDFSAVILSNLAGADQVFLVGEEKPPYWVLPQGEVTRTALPRVRSATTARCRYLYRLRGRNRCARESRPRRY